MIQNCSGERCGDLFSCSDDRDMFLPGYEKHHGGYGKFLLDERNSRADDSLLMSDEFDQKGRFIQRLPGRSLDIFVFCSIKSQKILTNPSRNGLFPKAEQFPDFPPEGTFRPPAEWQPAVRDMCSLTLVAKGVTFTGHLWAGAVFADSGRHL